MPEPDHAPQARHMTGCRSCNAVIVWAAHARTGKLAPIDPAPVVDGNIILTPIDGPNPDAGYTYRIATPAERNDPAQVLRVSHYATCPDGPDWARRGGVIPKVEQMS